MYSIIGVVCDFHYRDLFKEIQPAIFRIAPERKFNAVTVRSEDKISFADALVKVEQLWKSLFPNELFLGLRPDAVSSKTMLFTKSILVTRFLKKKLSTILGGLSAVVPNF